MQKEAEIIQQFLQSTFATAGKQRGVIAVSGGIDSAVSCTLLTKALGVDSVFPVLLPYGDQSTEDSIVLLDWLQIPERNRRVMNIRPVVEELRKRIGLSSEILDQVLDDDNGRQHDEGKLRLGNLMARTRMILLYDLAREVDGLVCGTENKSEKYLGYFTRFGDEASDIEPIQHLYKTQIFQLARELQMPAQFLEKAPSAGLWQNQTDEAELGFSYAVADLVLEVIVDRRPEMLEELIVSRNKSEGERKQIVAKIAEQVYSQISELPKTAGDQKRSQSIEKDGQNRRSINSPSELEIALVLNRVQSNWFKHEVPYQITDPR